MYVCMYVWLTGALSSVRNLALSLSMMAVACLPVKQGKVEFRDSVFSAPTMFSALACNAMKPCNNHRDTYYHVKYPVM